MKTLTITFTLSLALLFTFFGCKKEGTGGSATVSGHVKHHDEHIPNAVVYIKYGTSQFPGEEVSSYDDQTTASSGDGHYEFMNLRKGDYYLYSVGYDSAIAETVSGGIPVNIKEKDAMLDVDVPVTE